MREQNDRPFADDNLNTFSWQKTSLGLFTIVPYRRKTITWANADQVPRRHMAPLGLNEATNPNVNAAIRDDVIKWKRFPRYWPFVRGIHRSPVNCPHKGQWRGALMFSLICAWINGWENNREAGDLRRHRAHYDAIVMISQDLVGHFK